MIRCVITAAALLVQLLVASLAAQPRESAKKISQLREALREYRERNDLRGEALTLLRLGVAEADLGSADNARSNLTDAAKKMRAQNDVLGTWMAHFALTHVENAVGRPREAIAQIEQALAVIDNESNAELRSHLQPITHDLYGSLLTQTGQLEKAEEELDKASAGSKGRYDFSIAAHFGDLRFRQQRYDEARVHYQTAVNGFADGSPVLLLDRQTVMAGIYDRLTQLEFITGHPERARFWNDKALEIARRIGGPGALSGEVLPVTDAGLRDALKVAEAMKNIPRQAAIEARLGNLQVTNRKYGSAASHFERSLELYQSLNDPPPAETGAWGDLCVVYIQTGNYAAAENVLAHAHERIGNRSEIGDDMLAFLRTALRFQQRQATTEELKASVERYIRHVPAEELEAAGNVPRILDDAAKAFETGDFSHFKVPPQDTIFGTTMQLAEGARQFQKGDFAGARSIWRSALEKNPGHADRTALLLMIGISYSREGNVAQASRWLADGTMLLEAGIEDLRSEEMVMKYLEDHGGYYNALIESLAFGGRIEQSFEAAERARARAFLRLLGNRRLKPPPGSGMAVVQQAEKLRRKIDNWDRESPPGTTLADLQQQYEAILPRVHVIAGEYASLTSVPAQQIEAVRKELPENTTLLSYFVTPLNVHVWILDKETLEYARLSVDEAKLRRISCWVFALPKPRGGRPLDGCGADSATPAEAYAALIAPLRSKIRKKRLMIVPHGELHYVPFAALYDGKRGRYLVEDYPITYVPSASTIRFLREKDSPVRGTALVLGDPTNARLPGAGREALLVAAKLHTTAKVGREAQESALYRLNGKVDLVHIAAHGTYDATNPLFSAIHLAEGNDENGRLNVDEIQSRLDLSGVNLVVLSACRSGVGKRSGGDEIVGLTRSLLYAGSPGVIATLWNISDDATPPLIEKLYDRLLDGAAASDALRAAQVDMLRDPRFAAPRYWAAFFLTGDPRGRWFQPTSVQGSSAGEAPRPRAAPRRSSRLIPAEPASKWIGAQKPAADDARCPNCSQQHDGHDRWREALWDTRELRATRE